MWQNSATWLDKTIQWSGIRIHSSPDPSFLFLLQKWVRLTRHGLFLASFPQLWDKIWEWPGNEASFSLCTNCTTSNWKLGGAWERLDVTESKNLVTQITLVAQSKSCCHNYDNWSIIARKQQIPAKCVIKSWNSSPKAQMHKIGEIPSGLCYQTC